jgi:hypothetical protein
MSEKIICKITGTLQIAKLELERGDTLVARTERFSAKSRWRIFAGISKPSSPKACA